MPPSTASNSLDVPKDRRDGSGRKGLGEVDDRNSGASNSKDGLESKSNVADKSNNQNDDEPRIRTKDGLKISHLDSRRRTVIEPRRADAEASKTNIFNDPRAKARIRRHTGSGDERPKKELITRGSVHKASDVARPSKAVRQNSSNDSKRRATVLIEKKSFNEGSRSTSRTAEPESTAQPSEESAEVKQVVRSRKSRLVSQDKVRKATKAGSKRSSKRETADLAEDLAFLSSSLGDLLQENDDLDFFTEKQMPGSCEWLLEEPLLAELLKDPKQAQVLWCTGRPGCGKSVFASALINHLRESDARCAFHFFRFGSEAKNELGPLLVSLAYQLAESIPQYRSQLKRLFEQGLCIQKSAPRLIWQKLFVTTLFKIDLQDPLYIIVDGLDECDSSSLLLKLLGDVSSSKAKLCITLVSRKTQPLARSFDKLSKTTKVETLSLEDVDEDLRMYVEEEMETMRGDQSFKDRVSERIIAKADRNFLWANLVMKEVLQCHTEKEIEDALQDVPQDLGHLYERMDTTLARTSRPADHALARTILMWTVCSRQRLTLDQLSDALKPEYAEVLDLKLTISQVCGEFVVLEAGGTVAMVHATARDFLVENKNITFYIPAAESHQKIFTKCLSELISASSKIQMGQAKPRSFLSYAATSWAYHLDMASMFLDQESLLLLAQFFRGPAILSWIYLLSVYGQLGVLINSSKIMANFLKKVDRLDADRSPLTHRLGEKDELSSWTVDLMKVVGKFGWHLKSQPKSIYKVVPAFCPPASAMYKTFCCKAQQSYLSVSGFRNPSWDDCFAKFTVPNKCLPVAIAPVNKQFAILTSDGTVFLYNSRTLERVRCFKHGERVLAWCFNQMGDRLVTYGFLKTTVWNVLSGLQLFSISNPDTAKAMTIGFASNDDCLITCSDDRAVRCIYPGNEGASWQVLESVFGSDSLDTDLRNSPRCAAFNAMCSQLAVGYRGAALSVWSVDEPRPCLIGRCKRQGSAGQLATGTFVDTRSVCWNTVTGHVMGVFNDGCVFKWHPFEGEYQEAKASGLEVKCSDDGKIFVTSSADGSIQVWDFQHFSPIYRLSCSGSVTDLAIDSHERRVYDIRETFCSIWEPNALLRQWETEDKASDTASNRESSTQISAFSEASSDALDPVTALAVDKSTLNFAIGNDEGAVTYYSRDGKVISELPQTFMTVEHICWSDNGSCVASADLSRRVLVQSINQTNTEVAPVSLFTPKVEGQIKQLLLNPSGEYLLISTDSCLEVWSVPQEKVVSTRPQTVRYHWTNSPSDAGQLIGFGYSELQISMWEGMGTNWQLTIDRSVVDGFSFRHGVHTMFPRPTAQFKSSDGDDDRAVDKVLYTLDGSMALIETSQNSASNTREKQFMLIAVDSESLIQALGSSSMIIQPKLLSPDLVSRLALPLGFVVSDPIESLRRKSFAAGPNSTDAARRSALASPRNSSNYDYNNINTDSKTNSWRGSSSTFLSVGDTTKTTAGKEHVLTFLDRDYWVCTYVLVDGGGVASGAAGRPGKVRRHHFLPNDWINMEWLELAVMRPDGTLLCPRNGEVAIVANGLKEECID